MGKLDRLKRLRLLQAQKSYLQDHNFQELFKALKEIALPNEPLILTGIFFYNNYSVLILE